MTGRNFCSHCGEPLEVGARFCGQCGTAVEASPEEVPRTNAQPSEEMPTTRLDQQPVAVSQPGLSPDPTSPEAKRYWDGQHWLDAHPSQQINAGADGGYSFSVIGAIIGAVILGLGGWWAVQTFLNGGFVKSEAYKAGVAAGEAYVRMADTSDKLDTWMTPSSGTSLGNEMQKNPEQLCEIEWLGQVGRLANTPENKKDFLDGCESTIMSRPRSDKSRPTAQPAQSAAPEPATPTSVSLELCNGDPYPFGEPLSTANAGGTLTQAQASGDQTAIDRATAVASIQAAWRASGERGPTNGRQFSPLGDLGPQSTLVVQQVQETAGLPVTGEIDAQTWSALQDAYC